ncbi:hypothetical protein B7T07_23655 [Cronobacter sakazakii]|uniref:Uncharacterized protein n=1 Tax=Cronobacter sakazakii TaxID=28141 RepID=A0AA44Z5D6_CROSK|nr:hypothetical protein B7T07_23655 [Cronobacter sakazakii]
MITFFPLFTDNLIHLHKTYFKSFPQIMDTPFYVITTVSRTEHITNLYVQKRKRKFIKVRFPLKS